MFPNLSVSTLFLGLRRNLIWYLLAAYAVAGLWPGPGDRLRQMDLGQLPFSGGGLNPTHLLLAVLLFCVGLSMRSQEARNLRRLTRSVGWGVVGSWLTPLLGLGAIALLGHALLDDPLRLAVLTGAVFVVAMPPANSSSVWSEMSGGQPAATVSVILLGTALSPLLSPLLLGLSALAPGATRLAAPSMAASLEVLVAFVALPVGLGIVLRSLLDSLSGRSLTAVLAASRVVSLAALLLLNYANAAIAVPQLLDNRQSFDAVTVSLWSVFLCGVVYGLGLLVGRVLHPTDVAQRLAFVYVTGMKNTGAALVLATTLLAGQPLAVLVPVFYTIAQHLGAALVDRWYAPCACVEPAEGVPDLRQAPTPSY